MSLEDTLLNIAENGKDWQRVETSIPGLFLVRAPGTKTRDPSVMIELNPVGDDGKPIKRKGLFVRNMDLLVRFRELITNEKIDPLLEKIDAVFYADKQDGKASGLGKVQI